MRYYGTSSWLTLFKKVRLSDNYTVQYFLDFIC